MATFFGPGAGSPGSGRRVDLSELMTDQTRELVGKAAEYAQERGYGEVGALLLLRAAVGYERTRDMLRNAGVDTDSFAEAVDGELPATRSGSTNSGAVVLTPEGTSVLLEAYRAAQALGSTYITPEHVVVTLSADQDSSAGRLLGGIGLNPDRLAKLSANAEDTSDAGSGSSNTPTLDQYGQDLTARARNGNLDPVVGREQEIEQTIEVLARRTKNNPVLLGEAGVGKTAIVEGLAQRIVDGEVPRALAEQRVVQLDLPGMLAGTRYRGDFEERLTKLIEEVSQHQNEIIVFLDELHTVVGAGGSDGAVDAANMLKPRLARGELHVVGATTLDEYRNNVEKDAALERRFQPVQIPEPSVSETITVLSRLRERYAEHHQVRYTDEALQAAAQLSDRYLNDRFLPDKAIDLVDQAGARTRLRDSTPPADVRELEQRIEELSQQKDQAVAEEHYERASQLRDELGVAQAELAANTAGSSDSEQNPPEVTATEIAEVVSRNTGVPVSQLTEQEKVRLRNLEDQLHQRVIGQDDAVHALARAVRRSRSGVADPNRPVGSFLFLGPTGVGKTELAKALAETLFGGEDRMVRLDMSEFQERHTASRLFGAPPGYVGYGEAGELTETVRRRPYSVVLLDEIEKAHTDVFHTLLQVLEDGRLTDGQGRTVDFTNTVLVMTSNIGSELASSRSGGVGFTSPEQRDNEESLHSRMQPLLRDAFRPEFLNRIDDTVIFRKLTNEQLHTITNLLLENTRKRLQDMDIDMEVSTEAIDWIAQRGYQPEYGARPLRRVIEREVEDRLSDLLLDDEVSSGHALQAEVRDGELTFRTRESTVSNEQ